MTGWANDTRGRVWLAILIIIMITCHMVMMMRHMMPEMKVKQPLGSTEKQLCLLLSHSFKRGHLDGYNEEFDDDEIECDDDFEYDENDQE